MLRKIFFYLLFSIFIPTSVVAQSPNYSISHYTSRDGLISNGIVEILQDKSGFIWIATNNGVSRFDGHEFVNFYSNESDTTTLTSNLCSSMVEDTSGYIWISTFNGLNRLDPKTYLVKRFYNVIPASAGKGSSAANIVKDQFGNIYYLGQSAIMKWNYTRQRFDSFHPEIFNAYKDSLSDLFGIHQDTDNRYWIYFRRGLYLLDVSSKRLMSIREADKFYIMQMREDTKKNLYLTTWGNQIVRINPERNTFEPILNNNPNLADSKIMQSCTFTKDGNDTRLWFTLFDFGIGTFDISTGISQKILFENSFVFDKNTPIISKVFADRQSNIWCASAYGIYKIINRPPDITNYAFNFLQQSAKAAVTIRQQHNRPDDLIIRTEENKLYYYNLITREVKELDAIIQGRNKIAIQNVVNYSVDRLNRLWIFTLQNEIICFDSKADSVLRVLFDPGKDKNFVQRVFYVAHTDRNNKVWLGSQAGLFFLENGKVKKFDFKNETERYNSTFSDEIKSMVEDEHGNLWLTKNYSWEGGRCCITRIRLSDESFDNYFADNKPGSIKADQDFFTMLIDNYGLLWVCGINGLITCKSDDANPMFTTVKQQEPYNYGLSKRILLFNDTLVAAAQGEIVLLNVKDGKAFRKYNEKDGLLPFNNLISIHNLGNSNMMLNYGDHYQVINFSIVDTTWNLTEPVITSVKVKEIDYEEYKVNSIMFPFLENVIMKAGVHDIKIKFSANDYLENINNLFSYTLEGFDKKWSAPSATREVSYNNLDPGKYLFRLKTVSRNGLEGKELLVPIVVRPYFYQTIWFKILLVTVLGLAVYQFFRFRLKQKLTQQIALQHERERISSDLHDDLSSGLTSIALMSELMKNKTSEKGNLNEIHKISETAHELVDNIREIVWALNIKNDSLGNLVGYIHEHARNAFEFSQIKLTVEIPDVIPSILVAAELRRNVFLVVKETLNNTIRYSEAENAILKIQIISNSLKIEISDDGKGFAVESVRSNASGLINMKKRMKEINGEFLIRTSLGKGSVTEISINLQYIPMA